MREKGKQGVSLSEVLSGPIGVAVKGGAMRRILERNTRLPADKTLQVPVLANQPISIAVFQGSNERADENDYLGAITAVSDRPGELSLRFVVTADGRLTLSAATPTGKNVEMTFATGEASDQVRATLLAEAPLPGEDDVKAKGLLTGLKRLFGR
jgi:molecular chaperone DnaK